MKKKFIKPFPLIAAVSLGILISSTALKMSADAAHFKGDVNEDGVVNILDFINLKEILLGITDNSDNHSKYVKAEKLNLNYNVYRFEESDDKMAPLKRDAMAFISTEQQLEEFLKKAEIDKDTLRNADYNSKEAIDIKKCMPSESDLEKNIYLFFTHNANSIEVPELDTTLFEDSELEITVNTFPRTTAKYIFRVEIPKEIYKDWDISFFEHYIIPPMTLPPYSTTPVVTTEVSEVPITFPEPTDTEELDVVYKPAIYLYPEETTSINVRLHLNNSGKLTFTYPKYNENNGWNVIADPDSVLCDSSGREYSYLFWEGESYQEWDMSEGFVVKGCDTVSFLQEKLEYLGLTPKEYNEFIVYWAPKMQNNEYNLISFQTDKYEEYAVLDITPEPDCIQRVFMTYQALDEYREIPVQKLEAFDRHGYTVIEWGGTEVTGDKSTAK